MVNKPAIRIKTYTIHNFERLSIRFFILALIYSIGVPSDPGCVLNFLHDVNARQEQIRLDGISPVSRSNFHYF